jgi:hypothetical protein
MAKVHGTPYNRSNKDPSDQGITYEEIIEIINKRHDFERFGDNDIM